MRNVFNGNKQMYYRVTLITLMMAIFGVSIATATLTDVQNNAVVVMHFDTNCTYNQGGNNHQPAYDQTAWSGPHTDTADMGGACSGIVQTGHDGIDFTGITGTSDVKNFTIAFWWNSTKEASGGGLADGNGGNFHYLWDLQDGADSNDDLEVLIDKRSSNSELGLFLRGGAGNKVTGNVPYLDRDSLRGDESGGWEMIAFTRVVVGTTINYSFYYNATYNMSHVVGTATADGFDGALHLLGSDRNNYGYIGGIDEILVLNYSAHEDLGLIYSNWNSGVQIDYVEPLPPVTLVVNLNGSISPLVIPETSSFFASYLGDGVTTFERNGTTIANMSLQTLNNGYYEFNVSDGTNDAQNYADVTDVPTTSSELLINGTGGNKIYNLSDLPITISANFINDSSTGIIQRNGSTIGNPSAEMQPVGVYEYTAFVPTVADVRSGSSETFTVTIVNNTVVVVPPTTLESLVSGATTPLLLMTLLLALLVSLIPIGARITGRR